MQEKHDTLRIGLVGAGANTKRKHIPGFQSLPNVEIVCVANRSRESSEKVAQEYDIPEIKDSWRDVVSSPNVDAVCIGTWPYLHREITCAALEEGKHVLCEARMAMNLSEARTMLEASQKTPHLVTQLVPTPLGLRVNRTVRRILDEGGLGEWLMVEVRDLWDDLTDPGTPLKWRQRKELSGHNYVTLGQWFEILVRWLGSVEWIDACAKIHIDSKDDPETGSPYPVEMPDHLTVIAQFENGAAGHLLCSAVAGSEPESVLRLHGSKGTLRYSPNTEALHWFDRGSDVPQELAVEPGGGWRVEEEFVSAIRGQEQVEFTDFGTGVRYMELSESVHRSWSEARRVQLPLP